MTEASTNTEGAESVAKTNVQLANMDLFWPEFMVKIKTVVKNSFLFRLFLKLLGQKLIPSPQLLFDADLTVIRFTIGAAVIAAIHRLVKRYLIAKKEAKRKAEGKPPCESHQIIPAALSVLGIFLWGKFDRNIFKIILYSSTIKALVRNIGMETGWYKSTSEEMRGEPKEKRHFTLESVSTYFYIVFLCYCFLFEVDSLPYSMSMTIKNAACPSEQESIFIDALRGVAEMKKKNLY